MSLRCVEMMSDWSTDWFGVCVCSFGSALSGKGSVESTKKKRVYQVEGWDHHGITREYTQQCRQIG